MGACASAESGLSGLSAQCSLPAAAAAAAPAQELAAAAATRLVRGRLGRAFDAWWRLWAAERRGRVAAAGGVLSFGQRRRLRRAFHVWAQGQLARQRAWRRFRDGDANLPAPPTAGGAAGAAAEPAEAGWRRVEGGGSAGAESVPTPRWMTSWEEAGQRISAVEHQGKVESSRRRRLQTAANARAWRAQRPESWGSEAVEFVDSMLPKGDGLCGEWVATGQYTDAQNYRVDVQERFMIAKSNGRHHGYALPPLPGFSGGLTQGVAREYIFEDFARDGERVEWSQRFRDGSVTTWSALLAEDPGAPGGLSMRAGQWREGLMGDGTGVYMGSWVAEAGTRGRGVEGALPSGAGASVGLGGGGGSELASLWDELTSFREELHSGARFGDSTDSSDASDDDGWGPRRPQRLSLSPVGWARAASPRERASRRALRKASKGWSHTAAPEDSRRSPARRRGDRDELQTIARRVFDEFATAGRGRGGGRGEGRGGITLRKYLQVEKGVHRRLGKSSRRDLPGCVPPVTSAIMILSAPHHLISGGRLVV